MNIVAERFCVKKSFGWENQLSEKGRMVTRMFGVDEKRLQTNCITHALDINVKAGDIVYVTGPSGSGKSVLLNELKQKIEPDERMDLADVEIARDRSVVDCFGCELVTTLGILNRAGLNDIYSYLSSPAELSEGQKWRYRLAKAIESKRKFIFADEWCAGLDNVTAAVISYNIRRESKKGDKIFFLAGCSTYFLADLLPDVLVTRDLTGGSQVIYRDRNRK
ncbi:MAG: hypothetical protein PHF37_04390 [Phycisphaerae bacterium]|nr:hypothetical protein [Phycisphaerae bacterium]